ncbi:ammonium transporter [Methanobrevibacter curvatus]|uniref:Ammonium transporter n=1 Tax=Methanobrevibacter curvatus TaxID=49547 RepID=A0A162FFA6_9EURY|nr:ammonium transporter [Methanobrevibacter curvatus]KZX12245.1 ammonia channel precursor [Methanobrevibacter curvatus]
MVNVLSAGDTSWVLVATIMVLLMSIPGLAFFYAGLEKKKNVLNTMFLTLIAFAIASIIWLVYGYQFAFGPTMNGFIGFPEHLFLNGIGINTLHGTIPEFVFIGFQLTFMGITAALVSGAIVGRMKFTSWILFITIWMSIVYIPICHWVWGGGWLQQLGLIDFAGGTVVETCSGLSALAIAILVGQRRDQTLLPHNLGYAVLGAGFLWFGWMGFNGGSGLAANGLAGSALLVSNLAAAVGLVTWVILDSIQEGKPTVLGALSGAICALVAITPAAGFVDVKGALIIGMGASIISYIAVTYIKPKFNYDDTLDVFGMHGMSGIWGTIATGIFAVPAIGGVAGLIAGNPQQVLIQVIAVVATIVYAFVATLILGKIIDMTIGLRVKEKAEVGGLDTHVHEEVGYRL